MITAGASPGQLYNNIRVLDTEDKKVDTIKNSYDRLERRAATDAFNRNVFSIFRDPDSDSYAPTDVVVFILRCMLYKARGTFFAQRRKKRRLMRIRV
jgi:hypothetical protein